MKMLWLILALCSNAFLAQPALAQEAVDLQTASVAIAADITMRSSPRTRARCAEVPCIGVSQAELGLALIASRNTRASLKALAELIRFRLDGGLAEDFSCAAAKKGIALRRSVLSLDANEVGNRCIAEYAAATRGYPVIFPVSDSVLVCRSTGEIDSARRELLEILASKRACEN